MSYSLTPHDQPLAAREAVSRCASSRHAGQVNAAIGRNNLTSEHADQVVGGCVTLASQGMNITRTGTLANGGAIENFVHHH